MASWPHVISRPQEEHVVCVGVFPCCHVPRVPEPEGEGLSGGSSLGARTPSSVLESAHLHRCVG